MVICSHSLERWKLLDLAMSSVRRQTLPAREVILVIDHHLELLRRAADRWPDVTVVANRGPKGLSGARNTGVALARGGIIAFLDDDAVAADDWLERMLRAFSDQRVMGVGGTIAPVWPSVRPGWFPTEFEWVVGCTHSGMPRSAAPVRNPVGASMSFRAEVFGAVGGFDEALGREAARPLGCEETELAIRAHRRWPERTILFDPRVEVAHHVSAARSRAPYFARRCYAEGISKARVSRRAGAAAGLSAEARYTALVLPLGVLKGLSETVRRRDVDGLRRASAIMVGLAITTAGYLWGRLAPKATSGTTAA